MIRCFLDVQPSCRLSAASDVRLNVASNFELTRKIRMLCQLDKQSLLEPAVEALSTVSKVFATSTTIL